MDLSADEPEWSFEADEAGLKSAVSNADAVEFMDGRLYIAMAGKEFRSYDPVSKTFRQEAELPAELSLICMAGYKGNIYLMFGADWESEYDDPADGMSDKVYRYDPNANRWSLVSEGLLKYIGKFDSGFGRAEYQTTVAATDKGIAVVNMSVDGAGNVSMFDPEKNTITPLYYTFNDGLSDQPLWGSPSCIASKDGIYYMRDDSNVDSLAPSGSGDAVTPSGQSGTDAQNAEAERQRQAEAAADAAFRGVRDKSVPAIQGVKVKAGKKSFTVKWKKVSKKKLKKFTKVEIQYSRSKAFACKSTVVKFAKKNKTSYKVKKLKKKKTYYVRVRYVKMVKGVKHTGKWSKVMKVRTK